MKVAKRVFIKCLILLVVIAVFGGGAAAWQAYCQSTSQYAIDTYLTHLIDNSSDKAFSLLDQSEETVMTKGEYKAALEAGRYSLYSGFEVEEFGKRRDENGNEYADYHAKFKDASGEVKQEEDFSVKKQPTAVMGIFDSWKILSGHCMIKDYAITVPAGSELYLDGKKAERTWISGEQAKASVETYVIPGLVPGNISVVVRHPALESVNATLDTSDGGTDYSGKMPLKKSAQDTCKEIGVKALKTLFSSAAKEKLQDSDKLFDACKDTAEKFVKKQAKEFHQENDVLKSVAVSGFAAEFGDLVFTEEKNGAITTEMKFSFHSVVRMDRTTDTEEVREDGTPVQRVEAHSYSKDASAKLVMSWQDGAWQIASFELPVIAE